MIKAIAIDDEPLALEIIVKYCNQISDIQLLATFTSPFSAIEYIESNQVDLLFLDILMPELEGFDVIKMVESKSKVILTTAYNEYALKSYEFGVLDYLMKPISFPRFYDAISKYKNLEAKSNKEKDEIIYINLGHEYFSLKLDSIIYVQGQGDYVEIHFDEKKLLTRENLKELEYKYDNFIRIHKSFLVNKSHISRIKTNFINLQNGKVLPIGRQYKQSIKELVASKTID